MKRGEVVDIHVHYNFTKFHQNRMKNKKVLIIAHFSVQNFKVSVELWKSYIVTLRTQNPDLEVQPLLLNFSKTEIRFFG